MRVSAGFTASAELLVDLTECDANSSSCNGNLISRIGNGLNLVFLTKTNQMSP